MTQEKYRQDMSVENFVNLVSQIENSRKDNPLEDYCDFIEKCEFAKEAKYFNEYCEDNGNGCEHKNYILNDMKLLRRCQI